MNTTHGPIYENMEENRSKKHLACFAAKFLLNKNNSGQRKMAKDIEHDAPFQGLIF